MDLPKITPEQSVLDLEKKVSGFVENMKKAAMPEVELQPVLDKIKEVKKSLEDEYKEISDSIEREIYVLMDRVGEKKLKICKLDAELKEEELKGNHPFCSIYSRVPPLHENSSDARFEEFLGKYKTSLELSQEISQYMFNVERLLGLHRSLDDRYSNVMILDYLINKMSDLISHHTRIKTPKLQESYKEKYCNFGRISKMVEMRNDDIQRDIEKIRKVADDMKVELDKPKRKITDPELSEDLFEKPEDKKKTKK